MTDLFELTVDKKLSFEIHAFRHSISAAFDDIYSQAETLEEPRQLAVHES